MSAETLHRAATLMRERAGYAPDGLWFADCRPDGRTWVRFGHPDDDVAAHGYPAAARHIASWHPAVALAVADWLDNMARAMVGTSYGDLPFEDQALAVARAYLGETA